MDLRMASPTFLRARWELAQGSDGVCGASDAPGRGQLCDLTLAYPWACSGQGGGAAFVGCFPTSRIWTTEACC